MARVFRTALWAKDAIAHGDQYRVDKEKVDLETWQKDCEGQEVINGKCWLPECIFSYDIKPEWTEEVQP